MSLLSVAHSRPSMRRKRMPLGAWLALGLGCVSPFSPPAPVAAPEPATPPQGVPTEAPAPSYVPLLSSSKPLLTRDLPGITFGMALPVPPPSEGLLSKLVSQAGHQIPEEAFLLRAQLDPQQQKLTGLVLEYASVEELERAVSGWTAPQLVRQGQSCARIWRGADRVRARSVDPRPISPYAPCPETAGPQTTLVLEEYWSLDDLLPVGTPRWGFETSGPLLGQSLDELSGALREQLQMSVSVSSASATAFLLLPPLDTAVDATRISLGLVGNRIQLIRAETARGKTEGIARALVEERVTEKWGPLQAVEPHVRLATEGSPRVELNLLGNAIRSIAQRNVQQCPLETNAQRESAIQSMGSRWIEERESQFQLDAGAPASVFVDRGYRLGKHGAGALVHQRTLSDGCRDHYWTLKRERSECGAELIQAELWGSDCCSLSECGASAKVSMLRLFNAVQGRDVEQLRQLIDPAGKVSIHSLYGSKPIAITRESASPKAIGHFPDWTPHRDGIECASAPDGRTLCAAGPPSYRMHFYWSGTDSVRYLDEVRVDTP